MESQAPVLTYATPDDLAENFYLWQERPDGLFVRLPPPSKWHLLRRPMAQLVLTSILCVPWAAMAVLNYADGRSRNVVTPYAMLALVAAILWADSVHRLWVSLRRARRPSELWLTKAKLLVDSPHSPRLRHFECGRYEIIDLALCPVVSPAGACFCRLRVELRGGVAEIDFKTTSLVFVRDLEKALRDRLGLPGGGVASISSPCRGPNLGTE